MKKNVLIFPTCIMLVHCPALSGAAGISDAEGLSGLSSGSGAYGPMITLLILILLCLAAITFYLLLKTNRTRKQVEEERRQVDDAKLRFFTNVSHDLRSPLIMIISPLERLISENLGKPIAKELETVSRSAHLLMEEVDQILDFKQLSNVSPTLRPSYGDIARFCSEVCESYGSFAPADRCRLIAEIGPEELLTDFDRDKVRRILFSIFKHIQDSTPEGSTAHIRISVTEQDSKAVIKIAGNGLADHSLNDHYLHIAQEYTRLHGGDFSVQDNAPSGTLFTVSIPVKPSMKPAEDSAQSRVDNPGKPLILNVENNPAFRHFITEHLSARYDIVEAKDGKEAMDLIATNSFALIICNLSMPGMDGRELCRAVRSDIRYARTPFIITTDKHGEAVTLENLKAGADESLEKPFNIDMLVAKIERILARTMPERTDVDAFGNRISKLDRELLDRINAEIEENLQDSEYTIESLCSKLRISRSGLYKKLISLTSKSPLEYMRDQRLEKGRIMLENGETSVSQIAWNVGFSPKQFSKHFKDVYGCLPSEYIHHLAD